MIERRTGRPIRSIDRYLVRAAELTPRPQRDQFVDGERSRHAAAIADEIGLVFAWLAGIVQVDTYSPPSGGFAARRERTNSSRPWHSCSLTPFANANWLPAV